MYHQKLQHTIFTLLIIGVFEKLNAYTRRKLKIFSMGYETNCLQTVGTETDFETDFRIQGRNIAL